MRRISEPLRRPRLEEYVGARGGSFRSDIQSVGPSLRVPDSVTRSGMSVGDGTDIRFAGITMALWTGTPRYARS